MKLWAGQNSEGKANSSGQLSTKDDEQNFFRSSRVASSIIVSVCNLLAHPR